MTSSGSDRRQTTTLPDRTTEVRPETRITPERARSILDYLIMQRQQLRLEGATAVLLEVNRVGIVYWQQELSRATIAGFRARATMRPE
jgi:hypothetical protein